MAPGQPWVIPSRRNSSSFIQLHPVASVESVDFVELSVVFLVLCKVGAFKRIYAQVPRVQPLLARS